MNYLKSVTIQGILVSLIGMLSARFGISSFIMPEEASAIADVLLQLGGLVLAVYGRKKAQGPL